MKCKEDRQVTINSTTNQSGICVGDQKSQTHAGFQIKIMEAVASARNMTYGWSRITRKSTYSNPMVPGVGHEECSVVVAVFVEERDDCELDITSTSVST